VLIVGGRVIDPASGLDSIVDIAIDNGRVVAMGKNLSRAGLSHPSSIIDAHNLIVTPGLVDPHVHLREPGFEYKEDVASGTRSAVAGGFTTVCCMPNTLPALDSPELISFVEAQAYKSALARVFCVAAATKGRRGEELAEIELLARAGAVGFSDDGDCIPTAGMMSQTLSAVAHTGLAFMQHCQDATLTRGAAMHSGAISTRLGLGGWPRVAEEIIIERDVRLNLSIGCRYHVQHISSAESVELVRRAIASKQPITAEASPHHLLLTHEACDGFDTAAKVNPPLREQRDLDAIRAGVVDGTISVLATDHAPHSVDEKSLPFEDAPFGLIGLETALALYVEALIETRLLGWPRLVEMLTIAPARLCNLDRRGLGRLCVGGPADITILNPDEPWTITPSCLQSKSRNTPFLGRRVNARVITTIVGGRRVYGGDAGN